MYMYKIDVGCSLKWFTASAQIKWYCFKASMTRVIRQQFSKIGENICGGDGVMMVVVMLDHSGLLVLFPVPHQQHGSILMEVWEEFPK